ncbi:pleckstrin homology domain-containing family F member 2-like isoform X3 [Oratosquilla oratoria]|uniref:pleckstrin homology domain-containing family F member 2-like isoform X3 n=1 Tax=Oratosquilla oratoria TaxID=337810 RepID=UPI003F773D6A
MIDNDNPRKCGSMMNSEANSRRIGLVESCFGTSGQPLAVPGRVLVGEGVLTKMCRKKPKPRQFFLFNDILVYGNIVLNKKKYNKQHIIPLEEVQLSSLEDDGQFRNGWLIKTPTKSFAVYAATATEKAEWMAHINKCVNDLLRKSGKKAAEMHAAVWVPDAEASVCMHCKKTQFTVIQRRHHCRKCGKVVCGPCSSKRVLLPHQSSKPLRVCLTCHDEFSTQRNNLGDTQAHHDLIVVSSDEEEPACTTLRTAPATPDVSKTEALHEEEQQDSSDEGGEDAVDRDAHNLHKNCDLFGPQEDEDDDAPPPTLWWDDIDLRESNKEHGNKDRNNDSSGEDDSDDDAEDSSTSLQSPTETMTFYEGNKLDQSNGDSEAPATVSGEQEEQQPQQPTTTQDLLD